MKHLILILALLASTSAHGRDRTRRRSPDRVLLQPGQCVWVGRTEVCADADRVSPGIVCPGHPACPALPLPPTTTVIQEAPRTPQPTVYACRMTEKRTPNVWELVRIGGDNVHTIRIVVKTFPHFEGSKCESEAERLTASGQEVGP
jgi:hypothetical protein